MTDTPDASPRVPRWRDPATAAAIVGVTLPLIAAAAGWLLLQQLAPLLRPLLVAVFLAYVLMPYHSRLRKQIGTPASIGVLAGVSALVLIVLALAVYASVLGLSDELPRLQQRAVEMTQRAEAAVADAAPWAASPDAEGKPAAAKMGEQVARAAGPVLNMTADVLLEACVVALYLLFLLLEGSRFPDRVRRAYPPERAEEILDIAGQVSSAIVSYLRAKVKSSLVLAVPVAGAVGTGGEVRAVVGDPGVLVQLHPVHRQRDFVRAAGGLRLPLLRAAVGAGHGRGVAIGHPDRFGVVGGADDHRQGGRPQPAGDPGLAGV